MPATVSLQRKTALCSCHFHLLSLRLKPLRLQRYNLLVKCTHWGRSQEKTIAKRFPHRQLLLELMNPWPVRKKADIVEAHWECRLVTDCPLPGLRLTPLDRARLSVLFPSQPEFISAFTVNHSVGSSSVGMSDTSVSRGLSFHLCLYIKTQ